LPKKVGNGKNLQVQGKNEHPNKKRSTRGQGRKAGEGWTSQDVPDLAGKPGSLTRGSREKKAGIRYQRNKNQEKKPNKKPGRPNQFHLSNLPTGKEL